MKPVVAIVGRPNVGKSTFFNALIGHRRAIVHDQPGVTRDRIAAPTEVGAKPIWLVDTGGLAPAEPGSLTETVGFQVRRAMEEANLILFVVDVREGILPGDLEIAQTLRKIPVPKLVIANKSDPGAKVLVSADDFRRFGLGEAISISAEHKSGLDEVRQRVEALLPDVEEESRSEPDRIRVAFLGRPNVGKSSLINCLLGDERLAVAAEPGTTRDVVDVPFEVGNRPFLLLDTAGVRRRGKMESEVEFYSVTRTLGALERADVVVFVVDAVDGMTTQDERVAALAVEQANGLVIAANKWDLKKDTEETRRDFRDDLYAKAAFLSCAPVRFVSAKTGEGVVGLLAFAGRIHLRRRHRFHPEELEAAFQRIGEKGVFTSKDGKELRLFGLMQGEDRPGLFYLWCDDPRRVKPAYERYWQNALGKALDLEGIPVRVVFRRRKPPRTKARTRSRRPDRKARARR